MNNSDSRKSELEAAPSGANSSTGKYQPHIKIAELTGSLGSNEIVKYVRWNPESLEHEIVSAQKPVSFKDRYLPKN